MLVDGWNPRLATAVQVWESLQQRDTGGRHRPAHQPLARAERDGRGQWPSRRDRVGVVPPPPWEERRKPLALNREIPTPPDEFYDVEEWDPAEHPPLVGGQDAAQLSAGP